MSRQSLGQHAASTLRAVEREWAAVVVHDDDSDAALLLGGFIVHLSTRPGGFVRSMLQP